MSDPKEVPYWEYDDEEPFDDEDDYDAGDECGRWMNGRLTGSCLKAGSEECDWECPYRMDLYKKRRKAKR